MRNLILLLFLLCLLSCKKEEITQMDNLFEITDSNYPTSFRKLTSEELQLKQSEFEKDHISFSLIDSFGFVGWDYDDDFELRRSLFKNPILTVPEMISMVKNYLLEKSEFTGITDTTLLTVKEVSKRFLNFGGKYTQTDGYQYNHLSINFGQQEINGLKVINSLLTCQLHSEGVHRIFGHWFPHVYIPPIDKVSVGLAKSKITGHILKSHDGWGRELTHEIRKQDLTDSRKVILPYINGDQLELRVCWEFHPSHWWVLIDTTTGEILMEQDINFYLF